MDSNKQTPEIAPIIRAEHHNTADVHFVIDNMYKGRKPRQFVGMAPTLRGERHGLLVLEPVKKTATPGQSTDITGSSQNTQTLQQLTLTDCPTSTYSLSDGLARIILLLENAKDKKQIQEAAYLVMQLKYSGVKNPGISLLKTSKDSFLLMKGLTTSKHLKSSPSLVNVCHNTHFKVSFLIHGGFSPKIENGLTLSDLLEESPDPKYSLSQKQISHIEEVSKAKLFKSGKRRGAQKIVTGKKGTAKTIPAFTGLCREMTLVTQ